MSSATAPPACGTVPVPSLAAADSAVLARLGVAVRAGVGDRPLLVLGSRALGTAQADSDVDAYVVVPGWRVALELPGLNRVRAQLERELGIRVSLNPIPDGRVRLRPGTMLPFKLRREAVVVSAPPGWELDDAGAPPCDTGAFRSYAMSGLLFLLSAAEPVLDGAGQLDPASARLVAKALLHGAQLALARRGEWASTLPEAATTLGGRWPQLVQDPDSPDTWVLARDMLVLDAGAHVETPREAVVGSIQWAMLRTLRGSPSLPSLHRPSPASALAAAACELASAIMPGRIDAAAVARADALLPRARRRGSRGDWRAVASAIETEWPNANPLAGF